MVRRREKTLYSGQSIRTDVYKRQIQETVEALRGKGAPIDVEPKQGGDKNWQAWTHDPDGNKIELMKISPESPQAKA